MGANSAVNFNLLQQKKRESEDIDNFCPTQQKLIKLSNSSDAAHAENNGEQSFVNSVNSQSGSIVSQAAESDHTNSSSGVNSFLKKTALT